MVTMLVTRPEPEAQETAARLSALGIKPLIEPMLSAEFLSPNLPNAEGFAALAFTSGTALRAFAACCDLAGFSHLPLYAVGDRTAEVARAQGFREVISAEGSFADLVGLLTHSRLMGPVLYPCAEQQAGDLARALAPHGTMVITVTVYRMTQRPALSAQCGAAITDGKIDAALFYSRRTAEVFTLLTRDFSRDARRFGVLCLSEAVAEPLFVAHFTRVSLAEYASEDAMMALALSFARTQSPP